jgi:hypothetical protein
VNLSGNVGLGAEHDGVGVDLEGEEHGGVAARAYAMLLKISKMVQMEMERCELIYRSWTRRS